MGELVASCPPSIASGETPSTVISSARERVMITPEYVAINA
jgi:hypothetical protein